MNIKMVKNLGAITLAAAILTAPLANASLFSPQADKYSANLNQPMNAKIKYEQHSFLVYKFLLDLGASANGTKKDTSAKHTEWCAKIHQTYDAASNTYEGFNGIKITCYSPY